MFVRIKKRVVGNAGSAKRPEYSIRLLIVESYREKEGPRQRILKYLGSVRESNLRNAIDRKKFVLEMQKKIDDLDLNLTYKDRISLKLSLVRTIYHV